MKVRRYYILIFLIALAIAVSFLIYKKIDQPQGWSQENNLSQNLDNSSVIQDQLAPEIDSGALLPDLTVKPLSDARIVNGPNGNRTLRFPGTFANIGDGPLELVGQPDEKNGATRATQIVYGKDNEKTERFVGNFVFHETHDHWHFEDFVEFELYNLKNSQELDQKLLSTGKMTFCLHDYAPLPEDFPGKPDRIVYPWCNPKSAGTQGISVGWADTYLSDVPGQELDITDLPDGIYAFRSVVDPKNLIAEKNEDNNFSLSFIEISRQGVQIISEPPA